MFGLVMIQAKFIKGALSGLRPFLATETTLKMMKNAFISPMFSCEFYEHLFYRAPLGGLV